jgi:hypothetical protein
LEKAMNGLHWMVKCGMSAAMGMTSAAVAGAQEVPALVSQQLPGLVEANKPVWGCLRCTRLFSLLCLSLLCGPV